METSPSQGVEVLLLTDQDFEDIFLADTRARLSLTHYYRSMMMNTGFKYIINHHFVGNS